ncbi:AAA family ATPase [Paenisporosarcina cavernae]|uniref:DNA topology modulation protein FlaR n=1 Tax=Paenisporosarcina cavernae TaxID=2320858 RepID=A0A385YUK2_9BACL|nr:AAA family ATPase [Paenisporosarcina cavernae]AYC30539.1 DNA topology modulation protein FlaR [Paenisporosarcina cavernae]
MEFKKIRIIGSVGSGKTTFARELSNLLNIQHTEIDNLVWDRTPGGSIRRTPEARDAKLQKILAQNDWIVDGVHQAEWVAQSFQEADIIVLLDTPYRKRVVRITKRFVKQKLKLEKANYIPTFTIFRKMYQWNRLFENVEKQLFFDTYDHLTDKIRFIKTKEDMQRFVEEARM